MMTPSHAAKPSGVMIGYLGLSDAPACILVSTSSDRVSWLCANQWGVPCLLKE